MNLDDFVVLPNNKARSVKLNARNMQDLQVDTEALDDESKAMEEKLQQLKDNMSKEKEARGHSRGFRWTSRQCISLNGSLLPNNFKTNKENKIQKLSAGKLKIRLLKDEPLTAPSKPAPPHQVPTVGATMTRGSRPKGVICGQGEVKTAGLTDLQTHVSTRDIVDYFQRPINSGSSPRTFNPSSSTTSESNDRISSNARRGDESPEKAKEAQEKPIELEPDCSQVLVLNHGEETKVEVTEDYKGGLPSKLLTGQYSEEESARYFQEALREWRGERSHEEEQRRISQAMWTPLRSVSVSAMATQADLPSDRAEEGQRSRGPDKRITVKVEFTENNLTYLDRLLLKKHRRTPIKSDRSSVSFGPDLKSLPGAETEEEIASNLTAEEEDFRRYCASLFAVPVSKSRTEPQTTTPESCLVIEVLDETCRDIEKICAAEQKTASDRETPPVQQIRRRELTLASKTAVGSSGSSRAVQSSASTSQPSTQSGTSVQSKSARKLHSSKCQTSQPEHSVKALSSRSKASTYPTAENLATSKKSVKITTSPMSISSSTINKSRAICGAPQYSSPLPYSQSEIPKSSHSPLLPDSSALEGNRSADPQEDLSRSPSVSFSLRSTFTVSLSSSTESTLLPKVYHSALLQKDSDSPVMSEQPQSPQLLGEPIFSQKLFGASSGNLISPQQSQDSTCASEFLLSENQLMHTLSSARRHPSPRSLEPVLSQISPVPCGLSAYSCYRSALKYEDAPVFMSPTPISDNQKSTQSHRGMRRLSSSLINVNQNPVKPDDSDELSVDSGEEMSSDSLGLTPHEGNSSGDEAQMQGHLWSEKCNPALSRLDDSFDPAEAETEQDLQTNEPEQHSESAMVKHKQSAGPGSEQFCDLDGLLPLGLDTNTDHLGSSEHVRREQLLICQSSVIDSDPTVSQSCGPSSSPRSCTKEHLLFRTMKDSHTQPLGTHLHSTRREEISGTSGSKLPGKSTPILSNQPRTNPRSPSVPTSPCFFHSPSPPLPASLSHLTLDSEFCSAFRPFSQATQEIMDICKVDQTGCEDPDVDIDTKAHVLHGLEQELRVTAKGTDTHLHRRTGTHALVLDMANGGSENGSHCLMRVGVSQEQKEEEEAAERDRQSVLLLP